MRLNYIVGLAKRRMVISNTIWLIGMNKHRRLNLCFKRWRYRYKTKTITFPEVPNIFAVIPLYHHRPRKPMKYQYEIVGDTMTIKAERTLKETS